MGVVSLLLERPARPLSAASRFVVWNGAFYLGFGALLLFWPGVAQTMFGEAPFVGHEAALVRLVGTVLAVVGWFYVVGGRTGAASFAAATIVDRMLVPFVLVPLAVWADLLPRMLVTFAVLDPLLAFGVWRLLHRNSSG